MPAQILAFEPISQPSNPAGFGKWVNKVWKPKDGDAGLEPTWLGIDDLTNRTNWLAWRCIDIRNGGVYANATLQFNGPIVFGSSSWPLLEPARAWERHGIELMACTRLITADADDGFTDYPDAFIDYDGTDAVIHTRSAANANSFARLRLRDLPDGGSLTGVVVSMKGISPTAGMTMPTYRLGRRKGRAAIEWLAAAVSDTHTAGNYATTELDTTAFSGSHTIDKSYVYFVEMTLGYKGGTPAGQCYVYNVKAAGTAARLGL